MKYWMNCRQRTAASGPTSTGRLTRVWEYQGSCPKIAAFPGLRLNLRKFHGVIFQSVGRDLPESSLAGVSSPK